MMRITFLKDHVTRDKNTSGSDVLDFVVATTTRVAQKPTFDTLWVEFRSICHLDPMHSRDLSPALSAKGPKVGYILSLPSKGLKGNLSRVPTRRNEIPSIDGIGSSLCPIGVAKARITK